MTNPVREDIFAEAQAKLGSIITDPNLFNVIKALNNPGNAKFNSDGGDARSLYTGNGVALPAGISAIVLNDNPQAKTLKHCIWVDFAPGFPGWVKMICATIEVPIEITTASTERPFRAAQSSLGQIMTHPNLINVARALNRPENAMLNNSGGDARLLNTSSGITLPAGISSTVLNDDTQAKKIRYCATVDNPDVAGTTRLICVTIFIPIDITIS